ncbi:MAG TPA: hypothetical protein VLX31_14320 [Streptosporangiaceae bacterium]|nr:hypothetical protein [Streptosporangiaceae bacterium]
MSGQGNPQLMATGQLGRAEVMNVRVTGSSIQSGGAPPEQVCVFELMVYLDNTPPFPAEVRKRVPIYALANIQPGQAVVAVRVDPADHSRVGIDFSVEPPSVRLAQTPGKISAQEVLERGDSCEAVIVQSQPLGVKSSVSGLDMYAFLLTVLVPGQAPYQIQVGNPVPPEAAPLLFPGSRLPAKVMPGSPNNVVINWQSALSGHGGGY